MDRAHRPERLDAWPRGLLLPLAISAHAAAAVQVLLPMAFHREAPLDPPNFLLTWTASILLSLVAMNSTARPARAAAALLVKALLLAILGFAAGEDLMPVFPLGALLVVEIAALLAWPRGIVAALAASIALAVPPHVAGLLRSLPGPLVPSLLHRLALLSYLLVLATLAVLSSVVSRTVAGIGRLHRREAEQLSAIEQLSSVNIGFQTYVSVVGEESAEKERKRIAREVHDIAGQRFTTIMLLIENAIRTSIQDFTQFAEILYQARQEAQEGLTETRKALRELHDLPDDKPLSSIHSIQNAIRTFSRVTGMEVVFEPGNAAWSYGERIDGIVYRLVQEALVNGYRHGRASRVIVYLWQQDDELIVNISDNGRGMPEERMNKGLGLVGMEERIAEVGGSLAWHNTRPGFVLTARIPVPVAGPPGDPYASGVPG